MAALTSIALASLAAAQTVRGYQQSRSAANGAIAQGNYQAAAFNQNASLEDQQAADAIARGKATELQQVAAGKGIAGAQRSGFAGQGVEVGSGSAGAVTGETQAMSALDQLTIRNNAARDAWGYRVQATQDRNQAVLAQTAGQNAATGYRNQGTSTLLTGAANLYGMYQGGAFDRTSPSQPDVVGNAAPVLRRYQQRGR